ncbi:hypothetical protein ZEAMMB73_Zm00001d021125 [Zea mays]|uniref:Uncharacterized protein n=1 Tax=Zea mays TaxID=4577 RepID=A0A1D6I8E7_MAIZE|nr:hypothetical protein ZEAMMB73_Zm00001d021125 [Zea mays]ONM56318.1 hypothetical protein ZEAMMB73_Zm00001d021125 [Zea mays]
MKAGLRENSPTTLIVVGLFVYPIVKKGLPKKIREVTDCYFLPRRSWPSALTTYGVVCAASFGAEMLLEVWINKRSKRTVALSGRWINDAPHALSW